MNSRIADSSQETGFAIARRRDLMINLRRALHRRPELGWCEFATTSRIAAELTRHVPGVVLTWGKELYGGETRLGVPDADVLRAAASRAREWGVSEDHLVRMEDGWTGLVARLAGPAPGPRIALRFDIDALPLEESDGDGHVPAAQGFRSEVAGTMHACGHDGHAAIGVGVMAALAELSGSLAGEVIAIFQPAEEGTRGATALVGAGAVEDVDLLLAVHLTDRGGLGVTEVVPGVVDMLATRKIDIEFTGRSAHAALAPQQGRDALLAACSTALAAHTVARAPGEDGIVSVGLIHAGSARNVIASQGTLETEVRAKSDETADRMRKRLEEIASGAAAAFGVEAAVCVVGSSCGADTSPQARDLIRMALAQSTVATEAAIISLGASDDAAVMMKAVQAAGGSAGYLYVGGGRGAGHHTSTFDFDESAMEVAADVLVRSVLLHIGASDTAFTTGASPEREAPHA